MGMQSGSIKNNQITASSYINQNKDQYHAPWLGRLQRHRRGRYAGAWLAKYNTPYQWLQVDFGRPSKIIKISTQGRHDAPMWVRQYYVTRSLDAIHFKQYEERNSLKVWRREIINRRIFGEHSEFFKQSIELKGNVNMGLEGGQHMTPCDPYTKRRESHYAAL